MPIYRVGVSWREWGIAEVPATSLEEAISKVQDGDGGVTFPEDGEYVDGSTEVDPDTGWQESLNENLPEFQQGENNEEVRKEIVQNVHEGRLISRNKVGKNAQDAKRD